MTKLSAIGSRQRNAGVAVVRLALASLLLLQSPLHAAELAPVDVLLTRVIPQDNAALSTSGPEKGERLAKLQSDLALIAEGLEGFANEKDADSSLKRLRDSVDAPSSGQFKDRSSALNAAYRALAVVDYTWAKRLPDAPCSPETSRAHLLKSGALSSWIATLLGPGVQGEDATFKLDQASAEAPASARVYALLRSKIRKTTEALGSEKAVGSKRASLYCRRAEAYEAISAANRTASGPVNASRATAAEDASGVYVLARRTADGLEVVGAATAVEGALVTDGRLVDGEGLVVLRRGGKNLIPVRVERREGSGLALLRAETPVKGYTLAENAPAKNDLINAIGHTERTGAWTRTRGLVTEVDTLSFQTDAVIDVGMTGGAALTEDGRLAGVFVLRPARQGAHAFDWPVAVSAPALKSWLDGRQLTAPSVAVELSESGTTSIQTASRPLLESLVPGAQATEASYSFYDGGVRAVCMANCEDGGSSSGSSYSSNGGAELGQALGKAMAPVVEAMIFRGIPALFRGIGSLFKSSPKSGVSTRTVQAETKKEEKPEPPKPAFTATLEQMESDNPKEALFTLTVIGNVKELKTEGLSVAFTVSDGTETKKGEAITDPAGKATLRVKPSLAAQSFVDLNEESARHPAFTNASMTQAQTLCIIALDGSILLGALTVEIVVLPTPVGVPVTYACGKTAALMVAGAGAYCLYTFGKEALAERAKPAPAPSYASPVKTPAVVKKPETAEEASRRRAKAAFEEVDDHARHPEGVPSQAENRSMAGGQSADTNEPPNGGDNTKNANDETSKREKLLSKVEDKELHKAVDQIYRKTAKVGDGSSMDAYRYEVRTGIKLSDSGHASKLIERRTQLLRILRKPGLNESDAKITKDILIDIQAALSGL